MSTLDVTCGRCDKSFRVRAEFAGRATRCPGCSAPLTIGGSAAPAPSRDEEPERPRPRPKDADDRPRKVTGNWKPVDTALAREQSALVCLLVQVGCIVLVFCLARLAEPFAGGLGWVAVIPIAILVGGPALAAIVFGISARVAATGAPEESLARGTARASLFLSFLGLASLAFTALVLLRGVEGQLRDEVPIMVMFGTVLVSALASIGTFAGFVAQVGMARGSAAISRGLGRLTIGGTVCAFIVLGISCLYTVAYAAFGPAPTYHSRYGYYSRPDHSEFSVFLAFGTVVSLVVLFTLYHRLLAAARRSIQREEG
jgi:hypothetical protein